MVSVIGVGIIIRDILSIAFALAGLSLGLFPVLFGGLIWKLSSRVVVISLILGIISVGGLILGGEIRPETSIISLPVVLLSLLIGSTWSHFSNSKNVTNI